ncbi:MAG: hypothetical protein M1482_13470, partial [Chloroflexi bacterium]|nr:hypothetical protein [Chloroflexota bacterium]
MSKKRKPLSSAFDDEFDDEEDESDADLDEGELAYLDAHEGAGSAFDIDEVDIPVDLPVPVRHAAGGRRGFDPRYPPSARDKNDWPRLAR